MDIVGEIDVEQYRLRCEQLEETPPPFEAGICPDCGKCYHEGEMEYMDTSDNRWIIHHFTCPGCGNTIKEHFELVDITSEA